MAYLITHSLLSAWLYSMRENPFDDATQEDTSKEDFLRVLRREPTPTTDAMQNGIDFEDLVTSICAFEQPAQTSLLGNTPRPEDLLPDSIRKHAWFEPAYQVAQIVHGGQFQYVATQRVTLEGMELLLYDRLDVLKAGSIFDIKFSKSYDRGKYLDSTQHPMYLELVPAAGSFTYLVSNGEAVWTEKYRRDETPSIYPVITDFLRWLRETGNMAIYRQYWCERSENR